MAIVAKLMGGLGNQMFQYAAAFSLAAIRKTELLVDLSSFDKDKLRKPELEHIFDIKLNRNQSEIDLISHRHDKLIKFIGRNLYTKIVPFHKRSNIQEPHFEFDKRFFDYNGNCVLNGYWQSEKYFMGVRQQIRDIFSFEKVKANLEEKNLECWNEITNSPVSISIHVRRTDFLKSKVHHVLTEDYYHRAIERLLAMGLLKDANFFVFSDDPDWFETRFKLNGNVKLIKHNQGENSFLDMFLMSCCSVNIIANSSFSWWAAWLNQQHNKVCIAPSQWFTNPKMNIKDLMPENWIKI